MVFLYTWAHYPSSFATTTCLPSSGICRVFSGKVSWLCKFLPHPVNFRSFSSLLPLAKVFEGPQIRLWRSPQCFRQSMQPVFWGSWGVFPARGSSQPVSEDLCSVFGHPYSMYQRVSAASIRSTGMRYQEMVAKASGVLATKFRGRSSKIPEGSPGATHFKLLVCMRPVIRVVCGKLTSRSRDESLGGVGHLAVGSGIQEGFFEIE